MWSGIVPGISITKGRCFGRVIAKGDEVDTRVNLAVVRHRSVFGRVSAIVGGGYWKGRPGGQCGRVVLYAWWLHNNGRAQNCGTIW